MNTNYNPDVLTCLANLSNDEVFTPPGLANDMMDLLPASLWRNPNATFLDPVCKSGVFLREIARRLEKGLETQIPDRQKRINHIFTKQVFGIAITELTSLLSRRSVYGSKIANGKFSFCDAFKNEQGNILFKRIEHTWEDGRCQFCGATQNQFDRDVQLELHAYEFIHTNTPEGLIDMRFDVIVGNPPYQISDGGDKATEKTRGGAIPLYHKFITQAKKLNPKKLLMVVPSRWFAGGRGLDEFRTEMLNDKKISHLIDYPIAADVFPGIKLNGGVCYFLWDRDYRGDCKVTSCLEGEKDEMFRPLNQFETFVRFNKAIPIATKVTKKEGFQPLSKLVSRQKPFGLRTFERPTGKGRIKLYANKEVGFIEASQITQGHEFLNKWKIFLSRGYGEGGEARPYPRMVIGKPIVAGPSTACTETYLAIGQFESKVAAENLSAYLQTKFARFLIALKKNTQDVIADRFDFVPLLNLNETWTDKKLYKLYNLTKVEILFIESMIRPMEISSKNDTYE
jgi:site-specific DNA-methyltransferase (adenine-specific)